MIETDVNVIGVVIAPILAAVIEPFKRWIPGDMAGTVAIAVAVGWTLAYHWTLGELSRETVMASIMLGVVTGLAAIGAHHVGQTVRGRMNGGSE